MLVNYTDGVEITQDVYIEETVFDAVYPGVIVTVDTMNMDLTPLNELGQRSEQIQFYAIIILTPYPDQYPPSPEVAQL